MSAHMPTYTFQRVFKDNTVVSRVDYMLAPAQWVNAISNNKIHKFDKNLSADHCLISAKINITILDKVDDYNIKLPPAQKLIISDPNCPEGMDQIDKFRGEVRECMLAENWSDVTPTTVHTDLNEFYGKFTDII